jgi:hypothetical protein
MRVVHVASGRLFGGIEQMLATLARTSAPAGMLAAFAIAAPGRLEDELAAANAALLRLGDVRMSRPASLVQGRVRLARLLETSRPDVAVFHAPWAHAIFAPVARRRGVPPSSIRRCRARVRQPAIAARSGASWRRPRRTWCC